MKIRQTAAKVDPLDAARATADNALSLFRTVAQQLEQANGMLGEVQKDEVARIAALQAQISDAQARINQATAEQTGNAAVLTKVKEFVHD